MHSDLPHLAANAIVTYGEFIVTNQVWIAMEYTTYTTGVQRVGLLKVQYAWGQMELMSVK